MALLRKHWKLALCECLAVIVAVSIGLRFWAHRTAVADTSTSVAAPSSPTTQQTATDGLTYSRISYLRQQLALTSLDLGAMGLTQAQATTVLSNVLNWYNANQASWGALEQAQINNQNSVQEAWREINVGPANQTLLSQLPTLQQNLTSSTQAFQQFLQSATSVVSPALSTSQQQVWATAQANLSAPVQYRYAPSLTPAFVSTLSTALAKGQTVVSTSLSVEQQQAIAAAQAEQAESMPGVLAAEQAVLPPPILNAVASNP
jgi:hypothetical protein